MKKTFFLLLFSFALFACSSDDDNHNDNHEIEVSAWEKDNSSFINEGIGLGKDGFGSYSYTSPIKPFKNYLYDLNWEYKKPNIVIKYKDGSNFGSGYIEENKMYLKTTSGVEMIFTRYR